MSSGLGPINAPPSARPAATPAAGCEVEASENGFATALEDAQAPASKPRTAGGAAKARANTPAKPEALPCAAQGNEHAAQTTATGGPARADEALAAEATDATEHKSAAAKDAMAPDLALLLPGWPATAAARAAAALHAAAGDSQDRSARRGGAAEPLRRDRAELRQATTTASAGTTAASTAAAIAAATGAGSAASAAREASASLPANARATPPPPSAQALSTEAPPAGAQRGSTELSSTMSATPPSALPLPALHASLLAATVATAPAGATPPSFDAHLSAALNSPAFAPALATQVSWLVREGVQHARLSLNPAEMGPVTVQIALDGTQARVDFSADIAATRAAIESSLPTLAAALHDRGLTLAGGGVFDGQPRPGTPGDRGQRAPDAQRSNSPPDASADAPRGSRASGPAQRGLVDLVA